MKRLIFLLLFFVLGSLCKAQNPGPPEVFPKESQIVSAFISDIISKDYEFNIIELESKQFYEIVSLKNKYLKPFIFEDMAEENKTIFESIEKFSKEKEVISYIPIIFGTRLKNSDDVWDPHWYLLFLDKDDEPVGYTYYYP